MEITCTLTRAELGRRRERWQALRPRRELTADGLRLRFDGADEAELRELAALENDCCAWAQWRVDGGDVVVTSTGHGVEVLHTMFGATDPAS
jgi:hypothetical protein